MHNSAITFCTGTEAATGTHHSRDAYGRNQYAEKDEALYGEHA